MPRTTGTAPPATIKFIRAYVVMTDAQTLTVALGRCRLTVSKCSSIAVSSGDQPREVKRESRLREVLELWSPGPGWRCCPLRLFSTGRLRLNFRLCSRWIAHFQPVNQGPLASKIEVRGGAFSETTRASDRLNKFKRKSCHPAPLVVLVRAPPDWRHLLNRLGRARVAS